MKNQLELISKKKNNDLELQNRVGLMFQEHQDALIQMIRYRLQPKLRNIVEPSDVLQEVFFSAYHQLKYNISAPRKSTLTWLRQIVRQQLKLLYRHYFTAQKRDLTREIPLIDDYKDDFVDGPGFFGEISGSLPTPSAVMLRQEAINKVRQCFDKLNLTDREIIAMRHFERLNNNQIAEELNITPNTASVRYVRAVKNLHELFKIFHLEEFLE